MKACPGGWAFALLDPGKNVLMKGKGREDSTTNNRMELLAVCHGLRTIIDYLNEYSEGPLNHSVVICTDSRYVSDNYDEYFEVWKKNGWRKANHSPIMNKELWQLLNVLVPELKSVRFQWVKAHHQDKINNMVDELARSHSD